MAGSDGFVPTLSFRQGLFQIKTTFNQVGFGVDLCAAFLVRRSGTWIVCGLLDLCPIVFHCVRKKFKAETVSIFFSGIC